MSFLILFLAFVIGIFIGLFLFAQVLKLRKKKETGEIGKLILWLVIAIIPVVVFLLNSLSACLGYIFGLLFGFGCDLSMPTENRHEEQTKEPTK